MPDGYANKSKAFEKKKKGQFCPSDHLPSDFPFLYILSQSHLTKTEPIFSLSVQSLLQLKLVN